MDRLTKEQRKKNMQAIKATGSEIETTLAKMLFARGHRYRKNDKTVFGKPDLTFKKMKLGFLLTVNFGTEKTGKYVNVTINPIKNFGCQKLNEIYKETKR